MTFTLACGAPGAAPTTSREGNVTTSDDAQGGASALTQEEPDWCAARAVLQAKCQRCHGAPTENGAPFALLTYADTQATDRKGSPRYQKMKTAIETDYMPPQFLELTPAVEPLTTGEATTLLSWLSAEPPLDSSCD